MALPCDSFADQTVATTSQEACCIPECFDQTRLLPDEFYFLVIDGLSRLAGVNVEDLSQDDLKTVVANAQCSLEGRVGFCTITPQKAEAIILLLLNNLLCEA